MMAGSSSATYCFRLFNTRLLIKDFWICLFFFHAEDGIRDATVTGVQTCALPISGWRLIDAWPARRVSVSYGARSVSVTLVMATAFYDGMCRPWQFNAFVFVEGRLAGTVSPVPMDSRTDGVLSGQPAVLHGGRLEAAFTRYAPSDPLCCPSRGTTRVSYQLTRQPAGWVVLSEAAAPAALRLPATGRRPIR